MLGRSLADLRVRMTCLIEIHKEPKNGNLLIGSPVTLASAYLSDRYRQRALSVVVPALIALIGFSVFLGEKLSLREHSICRPPNELIVF